MSRNVILSLALCCSNSFLLLGSNREPLNARCTSLFSILAFFLACAADGLVVLVQDYAYLAHEPDLLFVVAGEVGGGRRGTIRGLFTHESCQYIGKERGYGFGGNCSGCGGHVDGVLGPCS